MSALEEWKQRVTDCRDARQRPDEEMWQRLARWYDEWVAHNDYVDVILPRILPYVGASTRVLEIGPGSGAFTIPLASRVRELVTIEPSLGMREVLEHNLAQAGLTNVRIIPERAEEGLESLGGPFDLALAAHSLYNISSIDDVVHRLVALARRTVVLMGIGEQSTWYRTLHRRFRGEDRIPSPHLCQFYPLLLDMGVCADVEVIWVSSNYVYETEEDLVDWWAYHLHLDGDRRKTLRSALLPFAERRGEGIGIYDRRRVALLTIDANRNLSHQNDRCAAGLDEAPGFDLDGALHLSG